jgi:hypothetical protein
MKEEEEIVDLDNMESEEMFNLDEESEGMIDDNELLNTLKIQIHRACDGKYLTLNKLAKKMQISKDTLYGILVVMIRDDAKTVLIQTVDGNPHNNRYMVALNDEEYINGLKQEVEFLKGQIELREARIEHLSN